MLLQVENLSIEFKVDGRWTPAVSDVSFSVKKGEILALVGESGCGKSVTCLSLARLVPEPPARCASGKILLEDEGRQLDVLKMDRRALRRIRGGKIAYIFQEPSVSLNPVFRVGSQIEEALALHRPEVADTKAEIVRLLSMVGIPEPEKRMWAYPYEMSGGMQQRVMIAMALASNPELLIADEPTTALDVTIQAQILELLVKIGRETGMAIIIVTHNLGIVSEMADRVVVMYAGKMMEASDTKSVLGSPSHPYTRKLLQAVPRLGHESEKLRTIPGIVPSPASYPAGCRFFGRCEEAPSAPEAVREKCASTPPPFAETNPKHFCACWLRGSP